MIRTAVLRASESRWLRSWIQRSRYARALTRRFVAGNTLDDAVKAVDALRQQGLVSSLDALGESVLCAEQAAEAAAQYIASLECIARLQLPSTVSLKLTQLGLGLSQTLAGGHLAAILCASARCGGIRVEVDMEASPYVDRTLELVEHAHSQGGRVRAVIQAYLRRSEEDIRRLNRAGIPVRLCKGAYKEPPEIAYARKAEVDASYRELAALLLREGTLPAIATHDDRMIAAAAGEVERLGLASSQYEFQMLYGIRRGRQRDLAARGHTVRIYIPYGEAWYPYLMRRMAERPANFLFVLRNILR